MIHAAGPAAAAAAVPDGRTTSRETWQLTQEKWQMQSDSEVPLDVREAFPQACDDRSELLGTSRVDAR